MNQKEEPGTGLSARDFVNQVLPAALEAMQDKVKGLRCVVGLHLLGEEGGKWTLRIEPGHITVEEGMTDYWDCAISIPASDYLAMLSGRLNPYQAVSKGKIGMSGNLGLAAKLRFLFRV